MTAPAARAVVSQGPLPRRRRPGGGGGLFRELIMYAWVLFSHLLGAAVWTGGHLVLALGVLPGALRARDPARLIAFERIYERIGIPALIVQVASGLWLAVRLLPPSHWLELAAAGARLGSSHSSSACSAPRCFWPPTRAATAHPAPDARAPAATRLACRAAVTLFGVLLVAAGVAFRTGGFF